MSEITHATIVPGWTLGPEDIWYKEVANHLKNARGIEVTIADMPRPDTPDPLEWTATLDSYIRPHERQLVIAHSLGFMATVNWAAERATHDSSFRLGALMSVAGNVSPVGFSEIAPHFDDRVEALKHKLTMVRDSLLYQPVGIYGIHDPFVDLSHAEIVRKYLGAQLLIDPQQGHYSGMYVNASGGPYVPEQPTFESATQYALENLGRSDAELRDALPDLPNPVQPYDSRINQRSRFVEAQWFPIAETGKVMIDVSRKYGPIPYGSATG
ncbi:MAG TPA: alpha/beta hydrolase [Candidatus Saccharimonadales bacterium]|nr:alpha/beta hydrolase [Candidatus Saccharimonadales bacterium]